MGGYRRTGGLGRARATAAIVLVALALIGTGLPATAAPEPKQPKPPAPSPAPTAPAQPPVTPPLPEAEKAPPAPPLPVGPVPARPKAGEELVDRRTERSKTFATDKVGQYRSVLYPERVHFKDSNGAFQEIDAELGPSTDGVRKAKANAFALELADDANAPTVARLRLDDQVSVGFSIEGAGAVKAKVDKAASTYAGVSEGVELRLTSRPDGLKEELVLASAAAGDRFVFPLDLKGLTAAIDANGDVVYRDKTGAERARTPHGFMTDSALDPRSGEAPLSTGVAYALVPSAKGIALEVSLDRAWLADPARVWPVVVDPQIAVGANADDTYVMSGFHRDNSFDPELKVGTYDGGAHVGRSYARFDTSAINAKIVNWAQLHVGERWSWNCGAGWPSVHRVTGGWDGRTMQDWPGAPFDPNPAGGVISADGPCNGRLVVYDVTSAAAYWAANPLQSYGLALDTSAGDNNAWKKFASSETGAPPALHVNWSDPPPPPTGNPFGYPDGVYPFVGGVWVRGWAIDPDTAGPVNVHVYRDNNVFVAGLLADSSRPDVGAAFPGYGNNHGYDDFLPMSPGYHNVCAYALNVGGGSTNPLLGCRAVVVPARGANEPLGGFDTTVGPGGAQIRGWTLDPDTAAPISVAVYSGVDYVATLTADTFRPDVGAAYPGYGNNHGYDAFTALSAGYHNLCVFAVNVGAGTANPLLGCHQVTVPAPNPPAAPTNAAAVANLDGSMRVTWSPSAANGGRPIDLYAIYAFRASDSGWTGLFRVECPTCTSTSFSGLTPGAGYFYGVYAHNAAGLFSGPGVTPVVAAVANGAGAMGYFSFGSYSLTDTLSAQVNVGTGNLMISGADASVTTVGGARGIGRTYNSASLALGSSAPTSPVLGPGWRFSESPDHRLVPNVDGSVTYLSPSGANPTFAGSPLVAPKGFDAALVREPDGTFTLTFLASAQVLRFRSDGLLVSDADRNANTVTVAYPPGGGYPTTLTGTAGTTSARTLNIAYGGPGGKISSLSRSAAGVTASVAYGYDAAGRLETVTDAENGITTFVYDPANRITQITDAATHVTRFTYDAAGRVASVIRQVPGADAVTRYDYSTPGHTRVTDPNNNPPTDFTFYPDGRMKEALDARGAKTVVDWTPELRVAAVKTGVDTNPLETIVANLFDSLGLNPTRVTTATGAYSEAGGYGTGATARLPAWTKDTLGAQSTYGYDPRGNVNSVTDPGNGTATITRNPDGTVATSASPANPTNPTRYAYTNAQLTSATPPTGNSLAATSSTYDGFGRLRTSTSGAGMTTTFAYDRLGRPTTQSHSDGSPPIAFDYDSAGNLTSRSDATGTTTYTYDAANRPLTKTSPTGVVSYGWDRAGNLRTATDPAGTTTYSYDKVNRLDQVDEPTGRKDVFAYDAAGRRTDTWYNTGANVAYLGNAVIPPASFAAHIRATYDAAGQLTGLRTTRASSDGDANRISQLSYAYTVPGGSACAGAPAGRPTTIRHSVTDVVANKTTSYCYDPAGRLTSAATPGGPTYAYGFDANTNRTSGPEGTHTVNSADQLADAGFAYDADGNLTAGDNLAALTYNGMSQTTSITPVGGSATAYSYGGSGQAERTTAGPTTALHGLLGLATETTAGATTSYIREASGALVAERTPAGDYYYVFDGQGSVIALVDPSGTQRAAYTYDPYGANATATGMNGALPPNPWRWSGSYLDATGLYKLGARYYDPTLGRFTQVDPVAGGSANDYDYCSGDPVNCNDLDGTKQRKRTPEEQEQVDKMAGECRSGADAFYSSSSFCSGFLKALSKDDLTDYGFGFVPNTRPRYFHCPGWVQGLSAGFGYGDYARASLQVGRGEYSKAINTAAKTTGISDAAGQVLGKYALPVGAGATAIDAACTNF